LEVNDVTHYIRKLCAANPISLRNPHRRCK
jgi:hypothetical protein